MQFHELAKSNAFQALLVPNEMFIYFKEKLAGNDYKPIFAYNLNESTHGVGNLTYDKIMIAFSAAMGLSISNKTCLSPCLTTFVHSRSAITKLT